MLKKLLFITLFTFVFFGVKAQVELHFDPVDTTAAVGSIVNISVNATGASAIAAIQLEFEYDSTVVDFQGFLNMHSSLSTGFGVAIDTTSTNGDPSPMDTVKLQWFDTADHNFNGKLFDISFKILAPGTSGLKLVKKIFGNAAGAPPITVMADSSSITGSNATGSNPLQLAASSVAVDAGANGCVDVTVVADFVDVTKLDFSLDWSTSIATYTSLTNLNATLGLTEAANFVTSQTGTGKLGFTFANAAGKTLSVGDKLFSACFTAGGTAGSSTAISFSEVPTPTVVENTSGAIGHTFTNGAYSINATSNGGTFTYMLPDTIGDKGTQVCVPVAVKNFTDITSAGFGMVWDTSIVHFASATRITDPVTGNPMGNFYDNLSTTGNGVLAYLFFDAQNMPRTLPDYSALVDVCFDVVGNPGDVSPLSFKDTLSGLSASDANLDPIAVDTINGSLTVPTVMLDTFHLFGDFSTCTQGVEVGDTIAIDILADNLIDLESFQTDMLFDTSRLEFLAGTQVYHIPYDLIPPVSLTVSGDRLKFLWLANGGPYTWTPDSTAIFTLYFKAKGGMPGDNVDFIFADSSASGPNGNVPILTHNIPLQIVASLAANSTVTNLSCGVTDDGSIMLNPTGGSGSYTYEWTGPGGPHTGSSLTGLSAGTYAVTVTSCNKSVTESFVLTETAAFSLMISNIKNEAVPPGSNGEITVAPSVGGSYSYNWTGPGGPYTGAAQTGLVEGTYTVIADNGQGCKDTLAVGLNKLEVSGTPVNPSCNGSSTGSIALNVSGGTPSYSYQWNMGPGGANPTGLAAGIYMVTVSDQTTAQVELSFTLTEPSPVTIQFDGTVSTSTGMNNGGVNITPAGGTPSYTYLWTPGGATTEDLSGVGAGSYSVVVTDSKGCTATGGPYNVSSLGTPNPTVVVDSVDCHGQSSGSITISSIASGTPNYTVTGIGSPQTTDGTTAVVYSSLAAGSYTLTVTDANMEDTTFTVQVFEPATLAISNISITPSSGMNGVISYDVTGGTPSYSYDWNVNSYDGVEDIFGLAAGMYSVIVTDAHGCTVSQSFTVDAVVNNTAPIPTVVVDDAHCFGGNDGKITITSVTGVNPDYTINIAGGSSQTTDGVTDVVFSGLSAGAYQMTLTDNIGTDTIFTATVGQPTEISFSTPVVQNEITPPGNNGSISINVTGGAGGYTYQWTPGSYNTKDIPGIPAGSYQLLVVDANGCVKSSPTIEVIQESASFSCSTQVIDTDCPNTTNGSIQLTTFGGNPAFTYEWKKDGEAGIYSTDKNLIMIGAGMYRVTVTDENSNVTTCDASVGQQSYLIGSVNILSNYNGYGVSGFGKSDGSAMAIGMNGAAPYQYEWTTGTMAATANNLVGGNNTVTITDNIGCEVEVDVTMTQPDVLSCTTSATDTPCPGSSDGTVSIDVSGGVENMQYNYQWSGPNNYTSTNQNLTGLSDGVYLVTVTDANGNTTSCNATVGTASNMTLTIDVLSDYNGFDVSSATAKDGKAKAVVTGGASPYQFVWGNGDTNEQADTLGAGTVGVTVTDALGCTKEATVTLTAPGLFSCNVVTENTVCPGSSDGTATVVLTGGVTPFASYFWTGPGNPPADSMLTGLQQGTYDVTVTDANGTQTSCSGTVVQLSNLSSTVQIISAETQPNASDGVAEVLAIGGSTPYTYSWSNGETTAKATSLPGGANTITVTDALGCENVISFVLPTDGVVTAFLDSTSTTCYGVCDGTATVNVVSGKSPFTYLWSNNATTNTVSDLCAGEVTVTVTDADGKTTVVSTEITQPDSLSIEFTITQPTSYTASDGSILATVSGGVVASDYKYTWNSGSPAVSTALLSNVKVDKYILVVSDDNNCTIMKQVQLDAPPSDDCFAASKIMTPSVLDGSNDLFKITCLNSTTRNDLTIFSRWGQNVYHQADYDGTWTGIDNHGNDLPEGAYFWILTYTQNGKEQTKKGHLTIIR